MGNYDAYIPILRGVLELCSRHPKIFDGQSGLGIEIFCVTPIQDESASLIIREGESGKAEYSFGGSYYNGWQDRQNPTLEDVAVQIERFGFSLQEVRNRCARALGPTIGSHLVEMEIDRICSNKGKE